jgi:hypothetical protein
MEMSVRIMELSVSGEEALGAGLWRKEQSPLRMVSF